ncbi:ABC transporter permease [Clostridium scatologenes]|uniref:ABC transporter permease n=1 Tax=Clostridium scatologenes TaxID=1548 RepID=A0A0E3JLT4_CLOSL|nr:FtsX-like permease family protein [Clostridium scatologenes]AKA67198.1 protein of unknown function DUF214 [Clostridium scatologenes]
MRSYLDYANKYLSVHKKKTRLAVTSVAIAVTLVVGIFSMVDALIKFEKAQALKSQGNYHITIFDTSKSETDYINNRIEVKNTGTWKEFDNGTINSKQCGFLSLDEKFAKNLNFNLAEGTYPTKENEIMLEKWFMEKDKLKIGDTVSLVIPNSEEREFIVSGVYGDLGTTKAAGMPIVFLSVNMSNTLTPVHSQIYILFKDGVNIKHTEQIIKKDLNLKDNRVARNEQLLALMGQTNNNIVMQLYAVGGVLFFLVLVTAVAMIYNTFNISVMERVRQFGVLRCIGASKRQIKKLVRREGIYISLKAIPIGVIAGTIFSFSCSAVLKYLNPQIYGGISLFNFSIIGIGLGVVIGFLTVFIASLIPARKASNVSPVNAVNGSNEIKVSKKKKKGLLTRIFPVDISIGINNAISKKKTLFLMSISIALSIILFMGFSVLVNPKALGLTPINSYTPDIKVTSDQGISKDMYSKLSNIEGIKRVHEIVGKSGEYSAIEMQLKDNKDETTIKSIQSTIGPNTNFHDLRELNKEAKNAFITAAVFIYSFVGIIAFISILNIINTMNTSIESKRRYLGVMRAIGMSGDQLLRMVLTEAFVYSLNGCMIGCVLGVLLQKTLNKFLLLATWKFPLSQIMLIFICYIFISIASIINPLKRIRANAISEVVTAL